MAFVSPLLGFTLGAWLVVAGARKLLSPSEFTATTALLLSSGSESKTTSVVATGFASIEIAVGAAACIFYDMPLVRALVLALFALFFLALVNLACRFERFDCGCFASGRTEGREMIVLRGAVSACLAVLFFAAPSSDHLFTSYSKIWFLCLGWSTLLIALVASQARDVIRSALEDER